MAKLRYTKTRGKAGKASDKVASPAQVTQLVMEEAKRRGLSWFRPHHAAGMVGSFMQETGNFRRDVIGLSLRGDDGTAYGLMQWRGKRYKNLLNYAKKHGNAKSLKTQIAFAFEEAKAGSPYADFGSVKAFRQFPKTRNVAEAATAFVHAERPAGYDGNPVNAHDVKKRINHANKAVSSYSGSNGRDLGYTESTGGAGDYDTTQNSSSFDPFNPSLPSEMSSFGIQDGQTIPKERPQGLLGRFGLDKAIGDQSNNPFLNQREQGDDADTGRFQAF